MVHLAGFSYLERFIQNACLMGFILRQIYTNDKFRFLQLKNWKMLRTQTLSGALCLLSLTFLLIYDFSVTIIKYTEGMEVTADLDCREKSLKNYTEQHKEALEAMDGLLGCVLTLKSSSSFLLIATFHHLTRGTVRGESFLSSCEYKLARFYAFVSLFTYPILQWVFAYDEELEAVIPQLFYVAEGLVLSVLVFIMRQRLVKVYNQLMPGAARNALIKYASIMKGLVALSAFDAILLLFNLLPTVVWTEMHDVRAYGDVIISSWTLVNGLNYYFVLTMLFPNLNPFLNDENSQVDTAKVARVHSQPASSPPASIAVSSLAGSKMAQDEPQDEPPPLQE